MGNVSIGELHQSFRTAHQQLSVLRDHVMETGLLKDRTGAIPPLIWRFMQQPGGKARIAQWFVKYEGEVAVLLSNDPDESRNRDELTLLSALATELIDGISKRIETIKALGTTARRGQGTRDELNY